MRVLILSSTTLTSGTGIRLKGLARGLAGRGVRVSVSGAGEFHPVPEGVSYLEVAGKGGRGVLALRLLMGNLRAVLRVRPSHILASKPLPHAVVPALLGRALGAKIILDFDDLESGYWPDFPLGPIMKALEAIAPRLFDLTAVHTEELGNTAKRAAHIGDSRVIGLDQGVDVDLFSGVGPREKGPPVALYAAHLGVAAEGLAFVLRGFKEFIDSGGDGLLLVAGGGPLLKRFEEEAGGLSIRGRVVFAGQIPHRRMPEVMGLATCAVNYNPPENPANLHRASIKVREYLAAALPVATNIAGSDLARFKGFVETFEPDDEESFARALKRAFEAGENIRAREHIAASWSWDSVADRFLKELAKKEGYS